MQLNNSIIYHGVNMLETNTQKIVLLLVILFLVFITLDFSVDYADSRVKPGEGIPPAEASLQQRYHKARVAWCVEWADRGLVDECKAQSLLEYRESVKAK